MKKNYFIFGASSYVAKKFIENISKKDDIICFSSKNVKRNSSKKNIQYIKTSYNIKHIEKSLRKNIKKNKKNIFLFFNAVSEDKAFYKLSSNEISKIIKINYIQPVLITQSILKKYFLNKLTFIYFSSSRGIKGDKGISIYGSSKNAIKSFVRSMSIEYGELGVNFRVILLGLFKGGLNEKLSAEQRKNIFKQSSIKQYLSIKQLVKVVNFVISDESGNGSSIKCDNGYF
jgi:3-oxoacyl-[acyl-carrier protein] reductase|tara:strand:+ start:309 stop:998 length:690 start_codon:yes stop_codon:yes gene_type:complete